MYRILTMFIIALNMFSCSVYAISAKSAVLIDNASGRILYEHNAYEKLPMASTTKIMTGLLACESGKLKKSVKTSAVASGTEGSSLWLKIGEEQTLENLTYGLMLKSGNDAAVAIAEYLGGSVDAFALLMNKRAREIGAVNTNFVNPHGLDTDGHYTTAYDLALIAREAMKNKKFSEIVSTKTYSIPMNGEKWDRALKNHNKMLWRYEGCNGVKTGFTAQAKRCLVSCAERGNDSYICVTLNASDDWNDHTKLLDYGFENFETRRIIKAGAKACSIAYDDKYNRKVSVVYAEDFSVALNKDDEIDIKLEKEAIKPPSPKGSCAGYAYVYCNGEEIGKTKLITAEKIKKITTVDKLKHKFSKLFKKV